MFTEKTYFIRKKVIIDQMGRNSIRFRQFMEQGGIRREPGEHRHQHHQREHQGTPEPRLFPQKLPRRKAGSRKHTPMHST